MIPIECVSICIAVYNVASQKDTKLASPNYETFFKDDANYGP